MALFSLSQWSKPIWGWLLYDVASSSYILLVPSVAYAVYYRQVVCGGAAHCDGQWAMLTAIALVIAGGLAPLVGAIADLGQLRHRLFTATSLMCCGATATLFWVKPGAMVLGGLAFVIAQVGYILAASLYDAYLPTLVPPQRLGQLSGLGWGLGYLGGLACFFIARPWMQGGFEAANLPTYRWTFLLVAGFYSLVALPALVWLPRQLSHAPSLSASRLVQDAYHQVLDTLGGWRQNRPIFQFLTGYYLISDGIVTVGSFAAIYFHTQFGLGMGQILQLTLLFNAIAIPATLTFGWLSHRWSGMDLLKIVLALWIGTLLLMGVSTHPLTPLLAACGLGLVLGSTQSICRGLYAEMIPPAQATQWFGFHALVSKVSAIFGPLMFGLISTVTGNQRLAVLSLIPFFVVGSWVLFRLPRFAPGLEQEIP
ncbi:MAG TPA: MFS transporter [Leptolyngbyaceae cyanobacterium M65_K2018_010]|nr:MFS transporter [Leptolyngbyaceae cyanobacterium M65_K2018_010]